MHSRMLPDVASSSANTLAFFLLKKGVLSLWGPRCLWSVCSVSLCEVGIWGGGHGWL